jgi:hypothetical protein
MKKLFILFAVILLAACKKEEIEQEDYWELTVINERENPSDSILTFWYYKGIDREKIEFQVKKGDSVVVDLYHLKADFVEYTPYESYTYVEIYYQSGIYVRKEKERVHYATPNYMAIQ